MSRLLAVALATGLLASGLPLTLTATPAVANYSCEPGQPNCIPMDQIGKSNGPHRIPWPQIACRVPGTAAETADDLRFTNVGDVLIPGGTAVFWQVRQTGERGTFTLRHDLPVGAAVTDADVLGQTVPGKTRCVSRLA
jgi:hypothetical protein